MQNKIADSLSIGDKSFGNTANYSILERH